MKSNFIKAGVAAAALAMPMSADALSIEIEAGGDTGSATGINSAAFIGTVGTFDLTIIANNFADPATRQLTSSTANANGIGTVVITVTEDYNFGAVSEMSLVGASSVSDAASSITVTHSVSIDGGTTFAQIGGDMVFLNDTGDLHVFGSSPLPDPSDFTLKTVYTIVTNASDTIANVNANVVGTVPVPAAGLMLLAGLGGFAAMRRRKG